MIPAVIDADSVLKTERRAYEHLDQNPPPQTPQTFFAFSHPLRSETLSAGASVSQPNDKRSVSTDALDTLGTIHTKLEKRDAIHLAVEAVEATSILYPGDHIAVQDGKAIKTAPGEGLGIVDPFLTMALKPGDRFWFVMYPRQVHSLRHVWAHPAFPDEV